MIRGRRCANPVLHSIGNISKKESKKTLPLSGSSGTSRQKRTFLLFALIRRMDNALKEMVFKYGFRTVHTALIELADIIRKDAEEFQRISYPLAPRRGPGPPPPRREPTPPPPIIYIPEVKPQTPEDPKNKKANHNEAIQKKQHELISKDIVPSTLLTLTAMSNWIKEGKTYWWIAEETGTSDAQVSAMAKQYGLQSQVSKMVLFKKKQSNQ